MSIILNEKLLLPRTQGASTLEEIINIMRIIAHYRKSFFDLEACKQNDGVQEPLTATQIMRIEDEQQKLMQDMCDFILYGDRYDPNRNTKHPAASSADIKKDEKEHAQETPRIIYEDGSKTS